MKERSSKLETTGISVKDSFSAEESSDTQNAQVINSINKISPNDGILGGIRQLSYFSSEFPEPTVRISEKLTIKLSGQDLTPEGLSEVNSESSELPLGKIKWTQTAFYSENKDLIIEQSSSTLVREPSKNISDYLESLNGTEIQHLPQVDKIDGIYTDFNGEKFAPLNIIAKKLGLSRYGIESSITNERRILGKGRQNQPALLYNIKDITNNLKDLLERLRTQEDGYYTDVITGNRFAPIKVFADKLGLDDGLVARLAEGLRGLPGIGRNGKPTLLFDEGQLRGRFEALHVNPEIKGGIYEDSSGDIWKSATFLIREFGISNTFIGYALQGIRTLTGRSNGHQKVLLYNFDEAKERIMQFITLPQVDKISGEYVDNSRRAFVPLNYFIDYGKSAVRKISTEYSSVIPTIKGRSVSGQRVILYDKLAVIRALSEDGYCERKKRNEKREIPDQTIQVKYVRSEGKYIDTSGNAYISLSRLETLYGVRIKTCRRLLRSLHQNYAKSLGGQVLVLYDEKAARNIIGEFAALPVVDNSGIYKKSKDNSEYVSITVLNRKYGRGKSYKAIQTLLSSHNVLSILGRSSTGIKIDLFESTEANKIICDYFSSEKAPDGWLTKNSIAIRLQVSRHPIKRCADKYRSVHPEWFSEYKYKGRYFEYYSPDLVSEIEELVGKIKAKNKNKQKIMFTEESEKNLQEFVREIAGGESLGAHEFKRLVNLFGSSNAVDILYRTRPEFRGIQVETVKGYLADYLGNFLVQKGKFSFPDLVHAIEHLSDPDLREGLIEVIKDSALSFYREERKKQKGIDAQATILAYLQGLSHDIASFTSNELNQVVQHVVDYFTDALTMRAPSYIVESLREGRSFPDENQQINIKEIQDKKRVLIADDMGVGKSATAIMAKEILGINQAVIVAPSEVISTWKRYLSDEVDKDGKQIGYFKPGQAPSVNIVENGVSLQAEDLSGYEYILISQEKIRKGFAERMQQLNAGMLVVDESHGFKNLLTGVRANELLQVAQKIEGEDNYLVLLSGTPVPNTISDVAVILKLLYPDRFESVPNKTLVRSIINGDIVDIRKLLLPRMQMKKLEDSIDMPPHNPETKWLELGQTERDAYEVLLDNDELESKEKMRILRQFLLNPRLLDISPSVEGTKISAVRDYLSKEFSYNDTVVMFFNNYIEGVIRGDGAILDDLNLPETVAVHTIHGDTARDERSELQRQLGKNGKKMLLAVSGETSAYGVDFSAADTMALYNQPWTKFKEEQEIHRVLREGLAHPLTSTRFVVKGTIEEGIYHYIELKYQAIQKLLHGIPITELEKEMLEKSEDKEEEGLEVNPELAQYYFSAWNRMLKIFQHVKELGEPGLKTFLTDNAKDYAQCYEDLGSRSYQANAARVSGEIIRRQIIEQGKKPEEIGVIDIASGPEMLRRHMPNEYQQNIFSLDINSYHFQEADGKQVVGSFLQLPLREKAFDYANLSLALHYTAFVPTKGIYERLQVLQEMNRVLKTGGRAVVNMMYNLEFRDEEKLAEIIDLLGFRIVDEYTGNVQSGENYKSSVFTLEKYSDSLEDPKELMKFIDTDLREGLKFLHKKESLKDSRRIIRSFWMDGQEISIQLNAADEEICCEEDAILTVASELKSQFQSIKDIPVSEIASRGFARIKPGKRYELFKRLTKGNGVVIYK